MPRAGLCQGVLAAARSGFSPSSASTRRLAVLGNVIRPWVLAPDHELTTLALQVLLFAAGPDGPWHQGWVSQQTAAHARQTIDRLTEILTASHSHEIE